MAAHETEIELAAPIGEVFTLLADIGGWRDWDPSIRSSVAIVDGPPALGSRHEVTVGFYGKAIEQVHEIVEFEFPTRLVVATTGRTTGAWDFELSPTDRGTLVRWRATLRLKGIARVLDRGLDLALGGLVDNAADGLRRRLG